MIFDQQRVAFMWLCEYVQDKELARELVKLGYRGTGETLSREEFDALKKAEREKKTQKVPA